MCAYGQGYDTASKQGYFSLTAVSQHTFLVCPVEMKVFTQDCMLLRQTTKLSFQGCWIEDEKTVLAGLE